MYLGLDIGTSGVKAVLVDGAQKVVDQASAPLAVSRPKPLWSEQDPADWWRATTEAVHKLDTRARRAVKAIGLSGQMHGATCLDASGKVIRPAILWNDGRSAENCAVMMRDMPTLTEISGNLAMPGFTAPKLHWMRDHESENFKRINKVLLPKDYVRYLMSGDFASDLSDSAGTLWLDVEKRKWSDDILALTGLTQAHMPKLYEGSEVTGTLSAKIADDWGMARVPIAAGGGDNAAGAVGAGVITPGEGFISLGTSGVVFLADDTYRPNTDGAVHTFCHALPGLWHRMSVILSAASAVDFVARIAGFETEAALYDAAADAKTPARGAIFLPYLSGERTPHNDPYAKGAFFGLSHEDTPLSMAQAALEGVAFALADGVDVLRESGARIENLSVIGGGSRSAWWGKIIASAMDLPLTYRTASAVGPAYGAARLARLCAASERAEDICTAPAIDHVIEPDADMRDLYARRRETFTKLYKATHSLTQELRA
ncbi:xylulokinase [Robiginitomaculum antarcticum]|uniref:xylulokinase n=1 Tax=Robiginitomaculum antarcticum TaxID=437507 RepID=UPI00037FDF09|nr:xylulokinase [Robiginitomaculum antarcticum]